MSAWRKKSEQQTGLVLIGIVFGMMVLSGLTVALLSQTSTTIISQAVSTSTAQAYYAAESGYRYAASKIKHGGDMNTDLHAVASFDIGANGANFAIDVYPYYYETTAAVSLGSTTFGAQTPGGVESGSPFRMDTAASGYIKIVSPDKSTSEIYAYTSVNDGTSVTFSGVSPLPALPLGTTVLPVVVSTGTDQSGVGGTTPLSLTTDVTDIFPRYNGAFKVDGDDKVYLYKERDDNNNALTGISEALGSDAVSMTISASTKISLEKFVKLKSTGSFGDTDREVILNIPFPESFQEVEFEETFNSGLTNWQASASGTHAVSSIGGDNALEVTGTDTDAGGNQTSLIELNWASAGLDFSAAYLYGNSNYLSYDAQVKTGFDPAIPAYYAAGIAFRLDENDNTYGLSFQRGASTAADAITDGFVPDVAVITFYNGGTTAIVEGDTVTGTTSGATAIVANAPDLFYGSWVGGDAAGTLKLISLSGTFATGENLTVGGSNLATVWEYKPGEDIHTIVLIQKTNSGADKNWVAARLLNDRLFFFDNMDGPAAFAGNWSETHDDAGNNVKWNFTTNRSYSANSSWYYGDNVNGAYDNGARNTGTLSSPAITLPTGFCPKLSFWTWFFTEATTSYDRKYVRIKNITDGTTDEIDDILSSWSGGWRQRNYDLSAYSGKTIQILFFFDTKDNILNNAPRVGWYIDDVKIYADFPVDESTLLVRTHETTSIGFEDGDQNAGTTGIQDGDVVYSGTTAAAIVDGPPIVSSGTWAGGDATGILFLRNVSGSFSNGNALSVIGSLATATVLDPVRSRVNYIRAYYGASDQCRRADGSVGSADGSLLDFVREANLRDGTLLWPPAAVTDWAADNDYFTLVQWDAVNSAVSGSTTLVTSIDEPDAIIASWHADLVSPDAGTFTRSELGLYTLGSGSTNVYFDDFGVKLSVGSERQYAPVVQE